MKFSDALEQVLTVIKIHKDRTNTDIYEEWKERAKEMLGIMESPSDEERTSRVAKSSKCHELFEFNYALKLE